MITKKSAVGALPDNLTCHEDGLMPHIPMQNKTIRGTEPGQFMLDQGVEHSERQNGHYRLSPIQKNELEREEVSTRPSNGTSNMPRKRLGLPIAKRRRERLPAKKYPRIASFWYINTITNTYNK